MPLVLQQVQKLSQRLIMTPQMQQSIKLLQLNTTELEQLTEQEILENPFLEIAEDEESPPGQESDPGEDAEESNVIKAEPDEVDPAEAAPDDSYETAPEPEPEPTEPELETADPERAEASADAFLRGGAVASGVAFLAVLVAFLREAGLARGPRLAVVAPSSDARDSALSTLRELGATGMYPDSLDRIPALARHLADPSPCPAARDFAARVLTLPTFRDLGGRQRARVLETLAGLS